MSISIDCLRAEHLGAYGEHGRAAALDKPGLYDEIVHVPLIIKWPGETRGASISDVVSQMDIAATILEAAGIESPSPWSVGLRGDVDGEGERPARKAIAEVATLDPDRGAGLQLAFRDREMKNIAYFHAATLHELYETRPSREELYDLAGDPGERRNLAEDSDFDLGSFHAALRSYVLSATSTREWSVCSYSLDES